LKILVTGAAGFTGRHFIASAAQAGHETVALKADLTKAHDVAAEVAQAQADAVVHLGAISFVGHADQSAFYDVNLFGTLNLLDAVRSAGRPMKAVLLASSANIYGNCEHSPIAETETPAPVNHYAMSKLAMELMARARSPDLPIIFTRPFNYTGVGQAAQFVIPKLVDHFRRRAPVVTMGNQHVQREYNDVRFVCEAYLRLLSANPDQPAYNVCTGVTYDFPTVIGILQKLTGHQIEVKVDDALVRANEVHRLCGDPSRLRAAIGPLPAYQLEDTLSWMLSATA
jgi:nucleoside-diphosphate-sugar epimerase